jgi:hypothetical protein
MKIIQWIKINYKKYQHYRYKVAFKKYFLLYGHNLHLSDDALLSMQKKEQDLQENLRKEILRICKENRIEQFYHKIKKGEK